MGTGVLDRRQRVTTIGLGRERGARTTLRCAESTAPAAVDDPCEFGTSFDEAEPERDHLVVGDAALAQLPTSIGVLDDGGAVSSLRSSRFFDVSL